MTPYVVIQTQEMTKIFKNFLGFSKQISITWKNTSSYFQNNFFCSSQTKD